MAARVGLESGPVVVDQTGEVFGDAPNVAARVQAAAELGSLLVTAHVQRQVAGLFVVEDKGPHDLKGVPGRPTLYRLTRASGGGRRGGARALTPLVGREDELGMLMRRWERARSGAGQFVQIVGEPGLGKSRLIEEFRARIADTAHSWVEWSSSQLLQNTPLHPPAEWGRLRFGGADRLAELKAALNELKLDPAEHAPVLAPLLDIPFSESQTAKLASDEMRRRQLAAVVAWLMTGARQQTVALAFEDLHWAEPTTLDLMKTLAERGATVPLIIVATARPEFHAPWTTRSHHAVASLVPLDRNEIRGMVGTIAERHAFSIDMIEGVAQRTGGVPLFVEEVTRLILEGGAQTIPPTLQQSLAARLDRLGGAREVAQIEAVLGREFSYALLKGVGGFPEAVLAAALDRLTDADLLFVEGIAPYATYRFKHALIQDAAYESLLKNRRQALHRRAAETLLAAAEPQPELVAHHFTQAGDNETAIAWWGKAGDAALRRSAFQEATSHLGKAIMLAEAGNSASPTMNAPERPQASHSLEQHGEASSEASPFDAKPTSAPPDGSALGSMGPLSKIRSDYRRAVAWGSGHWSGEAGTAFGAERSGLTPIAENPQAHYSELIVLIARRFAVGDWHSARDVAEAGFEELKIEWWSHLLGRMVGLSRMFLGECEAAYSQLVSDAAYFSKAFDTDLPKLGVMDDEAATYSYLIFAAWQVGAIAESFGASDAAFARAEKRLAICTNN